MSDEATSGTTGVGVIGLGFMGRTHVAAYREAARKGHPNRIVAACDQDPTRFTSGEFAKGNFEDADAAGPVFHPEETGFSTDPTQLLANSAVELVSICTHTDTHVDLACRALEAGKHVLVEKPVATNAADAQRLADAARAAGTLCMPAMCLRFWPAWRWLRETVSAGEHGTVRSAVFRRLASHPAWSADFYADPTRSGGALFDLHVHDADFVQWLFGPPDSVTSTGTVDHLTTAYRYANGPPHVVAEGGWDHAPGFSFHMGYTVIFDRATADYAFGRDPELVLARGGLSRPVAIEPGTGYEGEVRHVLTAIAEGATALDATLDEAVTLTRTLEAERESLASGAPVSL